MSPLEPTYITTASLEYDNTAEAEEKHLKTNNLVKMIQVLKKEMNNPLKNGKKTKKKDD